MEKKPDQINRGKRKQQSDEGSSYDKNAKKSDKNKQQSAGEEFDEKKSIFVNKSDEASSDDKIGKKNLDVD
ncbi:hypothetical protein MTR_0036s0310 [Medicago truncatula]|uniref:Uncharacterized protein n=1 Tax=Medicago truncatula TaxID=3880 RepID=A0A072TUE5_MEDTR|nr:hypothetical protein MTR_0036s0310 [Medicago truncatula]